MKALGLRNRWLRASRLDSLEQKLDRMLDMLGKIGNLQGLKFKREKNPRRVEVGKRSWAKRLEQHAMTERQNGLLGLAEKAPEG